MNEGSNDGGDLMKRLNLYDDLEEFGRDLVIKKNLAKSKILKCFKKFLD